MSRRLTQFVSEKNPEFVFQFIGTRFWISFSFLLFPALNELFFHGASNSLLRIVWRGRFFSVKISRIPSHY